MLTKYFNTSFQEWREWNPEKEGVYFVRANWTDEERQSIKQQANADGHGLPQLARGSSGNPHFPADYAWTDLWSIRKARENDNRPWIKAWVNLLIVVKAPCVFSSKDCHIPQTEPNYIFGVKQYCSWALKDYVQIFCLSSGKSATDHIYNDTFHKKKAWATAYRLNAVYKDNKVGVIRMSLKTGLTQVYLIDPLVATIDHPYQKDEQMWFFRGDRNLNDVWDVVKRIGRLRYNIQIKLPSCPKCGSDAASQHDEVTSYAKVEYACMECGCEFHTNEFMQVKS